MLTKSRFAFHDSTLVGSLLNYPTPTVRIAFAVRAGHVGIGLCTVPVPAVRRPTCNETPLSLNRELQPCELAEC